MIVMEIAENTFFLALHSVVPWVAAAFFALLGLWFGYVLWFDWVRQIRPLRAEHRELRRRLDGLIGIESPSPVRAAAALPSSGIAGAAASGATILTKVDRSSVLSSGVIRDAMESSKSIGAPGPLAAEFWPIPEKAPEVTVVTGEVVPDKVRLDAARLVGIPIEVRDAGGGS